MICEYLIVSIVGTNSSANEIYLSKANSGTFADQLIKFCCVSGFIILSNIHSVLGNVKSTKES